MPQPIDILHVDDEPGFAEMAADFLEREYDQFTVKTATSASEGCDHLADTDFDCIVSDYEMPGQNGIDFLETVRENHPDLPFILFTGKGSEEVASEAISAGVTDYLQKASGTEQYELLANRIKNAVEHRQATQQRKQSDRRFEAVFEDPQMLVGILDPDGTLREVNQTALEYIDADHEAVVGTPFWETPWWTDDIQSDVQRWVTRAADGEYVEYTADLTEPSGNQYSVDGTIRPVTTDGEIVSLIVSARDITERRERTRKLEARSTAIEASIDGIAILDTDETYTFVNQAHADIYGYDDPDTFLGEDWRMCYKKDEQDRLESEVLPALHEEGSWRGEAIGQRQDGTTFPQELSLTALDDGGIVCVVRDISERKEREQALRDEQTFVSQALDALPDAFYVVGADGSFRRWNDRLSAITGYTDEEIADMQALDFFPDDEQEHAAAAIEEALTTGEVTVELDILTADGDRIPIEITGSRFVNSDGDVRGVIGTGRDITERKEQERHIKQERDRFAAIFEAIPEPIAHVRFDDGHPIVTTINSAFTETFGHEPAAIEDRSINDAIVPDEYADEAQQIDGFVQDQGIVEREVERLTADGRRPFLLRANQFELSDGTTESIGVYIDLTEQREREQKLTALHDVADDLTTSASVEQVCEHTVAASTDILDFDVSVIDLEEAGMLSPVAVSEDTSSTDPADMPVEEGLAGKTYRTGESFLIDDLAAHDAADPQGPYRSAISVPIGDHGVFQAVAESPDAFDTTDLELTELLCSHAESALERLTHEQQLRHQNERLEEFASVVAHDLRNPLNVAHGRVDLAREACDSEHLAAAAEAVDRSLTLIDDLLTLARTGDQISETESIELADVIDDCWRTVEPDTATLLTETAQTIRADPSRLRQLLENLFRNAVEHGGEDVTVRVGELDAQDGFYVADDGPGIPDDERDQVFDAGYSTTDDGTGFGLNIVQEIADAHGWDITVTDSDEGGARFEIVTDAHL